MEYVLLLLLIIPPVALTVIRKQGGGASYIDLGVIFAWIVFSYAWFPFVGLILAELGVGTVRDTRIMKDVLYSGAAPVVGWTYLIFLTAFVLSYGWRRCAISPSIEPVRADKIQMIVMSVTVAAVFFTSFMCNLLFGINTAETYGESYVQIRQYPKVIQQVVSNLDQMRLSASLAAIVFFISWRPRLHRYVAVVVIAIVLEGTLAEMGRSLGFLLALGYLVCVSIYVRPISPLYLLTFLMGSLMLFTIIGIFRGDNENTLFLLEIFQGGELSTVFYNSVDLMQKFGPGGEVDAPWQVRWVDILRFIPQQFLWFEKLDPSVWYVSSFYSDYYDLGGGLAFGAIAETVIGFGFVDGFVRGGLLGLAYAFVANRLTSGSMTPMKVFTYTWFVVIAYQGIRDTTFSVFPRLVIQVLPIIALLLIGDYVMRLILRGNFSLPR